MHRHDQKTRRMRRGTAMTEFVLALPLLIFVLTLTLVMGWALMRKQHIVVAARHSTWRHFETNMPSNDEINRTYLGGRAELVEQIYVDGRQRDALVNWAGEAGGVSTGAGVLASELLLQRWPGGRETRVRASYPATIPMQGRIEGAMEYRHGRDGVEWTRQQAAQWQALRQRYYGDLDRTLSGGNGLAQTLRRLYNEPW